MQDCKFYQAYNARIIVQNVIQSHNLSLKMLLDRKKEPIIPQSTANTHKTYHFNIYSLEMLVYSLHF